jgi:hypothetical protein
LYTGVVTGLPACEGLPSFPIYLGDNKVMNLKAAPSVIVNDPLDLTGATAITVNLPKADGTTLQLTLTSGVSITTALLGKIAVAISAVNSALLNVGENQTFDVTFTLANAQVVTVAFVGALSVYQV